MTQRPGRLMAGHLILSQIIGVRFSFGSLTRRLNLMADSMDLLPYEGEVSRSHNKRRLRECSIIG